MIRQISRTLTPWGWLAAAVGLVVAIALIAGLWNGLWAWLPWSAESRAARAEIRADRAEAVAQSESVRANGEAEVARSVERHFHTIERVRVEAARAEIEIRSLPDADAPVDPDRARLLHDADRSLCDAAPAICPATAVDAP